MPPPESGSGGSLVPGADVCSAVAALEGAIVPGCIGVVLGSGLGAVADAFGSAASVSFAEVPGFPRCRVPGHAGVLRAAEVSSQPVVLFQGRVHLYEGASLAEVTFEVRLLQELGARAVILTCAAGAVNPAYAPGDLALVLDHINLTGEDPHRLRPFGEREPLFPSADRVYDPVLLERISGLAFDLGVPLQRGCLAGVRGPSYETPAEVRALRALGADLVTMSTVLEALAAAQLGLPVLAIAVVANRAGETGSGHEAVLAASQRGSGALAGLLRTAIEEMDWRV